MAAIVERDRTAPGPSQCRHPARRDPIDLFVRRKAVDEHNWLALPFVNKGDLHAFMRELRHARDHTIPPPRSEGARRCRRTQVMSASDRARLWHDPEKWIPVLRLHQASPVACCFV